MPQTASTNEASNFNIQPLVDSIIHALNTLFTDMKSNSATLSELEQQAREILWPAFEKAPNDQRNRLFRQLAVQLHPDKPENLKANFGDATYFWLVELKLVDRFQDLLKDCRDQNRPAFIQEASQNFTSWATQVVQIFFQLIILDNTRKTNLSDPETQEAFQDLYEELYKLFPLAIWAFEMLNAKDRYPKYLRFIANALHGITATGLIIAGVASLLPVFLIMPVSGFFQNQLFKFANLLTLDQLTVPLMQHRKKIIETARLEILNNEKTFLNLLPTATEEDYYDALYNHYKRGSKDFDPLYRQESDNDINDVIQQIFSKKPIVTKENFKATHQKNLLKEIAAHMASLEKFSPAIHHLPLAQFLKHYLKELFKPTLANSNYTSFQKGLIFVSYPFRVLLGLVTAGVYLAFKGLDHLIGLTLTGLACALTLAYVCALIVIDSPLIIAKSIQFTARKILSNPTTLFQSIIAGVAFAGLTYATFGLAPALLGIAAGVGFLASMVASQPGLSGNRLLPKLLFGGLLILGAAAAVALTILGGGAPVIAATLPFVLPAAFAVKAAIVAGASLLLTAVVNSGLPKLVDVVLSIKDGKSKDAMSAYTMQRDENLLIEGLPAPKIRFAVKNNDTYVALLKTETIAEMFLQKQAKQKIDISNYKIEEIVVVRPSYYSKAEKVKNQSTEEGQIINRNNKSYKFYDQTKDAGFFKPASKEVYSEKLKTVYEYQPPMPSLS